MSFNFIVPQSPAGAVPALFYIPYINDKQLQASEFLPRAHRFSSSADSVIKTPSKCNIDMRRRAPPLVTANGAAAVVVPKVACVAANNENNTHYFVRL